MAEVTAPITVTAVNDEPERTAGVVANLGVLEGAGATSLGLGGLAYDGGGGGTEAGQGLTFTVTGVPAASFGRIVLADGTTTVTAGTAYGPADLQGMQFIAGAASSGSRDFTFSVVDDGGTSSGGDNTLAEALTITITNVAPVLAGSNPLPVLAEDPSLSGNTGMLVADLVAGQVTDPAGVYGIAVVGAGSANGTGYRRSDTAAWQAFGTVGATNSVLLLADSDNRVRFVPNANWNGTDTGLLFRAWDGSGGTAGGTTGNTTLTGGSSPYSADTAAASVTVTAVNDAPVALPVSLNGTEDAASITITLGGTDVDGTIASFTLGALPAGRASCTPTPRCWSKPSPAPTPAAR
ncbi:hypothetical protein HK414_16500 [Ramlibacter terrae]|uniref:RapA2 cadherin-like domain-containing protein n=1 Tax=Ramlibacter terrae TaxID=2732511 RepID=A0ABX6P3Q3_9BURK|nr:hypothetical protein HK414_16500 [Ramlibacter terrae]